MSDRHPLTQRQPPLVQPAMSVTGTGRRRLLAAAIWIGIMLALLVVHVGGAAYTPAARASLGLRWAVMPSIAALVDVLTLWAAMGLARRYPLGSSQPASHVGPHVLAALAYATVHALNDRWIAPVVDPATATVEPLVQGMAWDVLGYAMWAGVAHAFEYARREMRIRATTLRLRLDLADVGRQRAEAELRALKAELNPQLLGNELGAVAALVHTDPDAAERMLTQLGMMLRDVLTRVATQDVTLEEEIEGLTPFLAVERARFGDRLSATWDVDPAALPARVPHMLLQPLFEHALRGSVGSGSPTRIHLTVRRAGARLRIAVESRNAPVASGSDADERGGELLDNVRARLGELYGAGASVDSHAKSDGNHTTHVDLPWLADEHDELAPGSAGAVLHGTEDDGATRRRTVRNAGLAGWFMTLFAVAGIRAWETPLPSGSRVPLRGAIIEGLLAAALTTAMLVVALRFVRGRGRLFSWRRDGAAALAFGVANAAAKVALAALVGAPYPPVPLQRLGAAVVVGAFLFGILAAVVYGMEYARREGRSRRSALRLRVELADAARQRAEAKLRALKAELNPHFLGNALGAVVALVRSDPDAAERVLSQLTNVLRMAVERVRTQEVTLAEEIEGLTPFLAVERARFGDQLAVSWEVDQEALHAQVPHMILQPLVENAVKHGLSARGGAGHIVVSGRRAGERLELSVRDDGVGVGGPAKAPARDVGHGVGLTNARARLATLYGSEASLDLVSGAGTGTVARLVMPYRSAGEPILATVDAPAPSLPATVE